MSLIWCSCGKLRRRPAWIDRMFRLVELTWCVALVVGLMVRVDSVLLCGVVPITILYTLLRLQFRVCKECSLTTPKIQFWRTK